MAKEETKRDRSPNFPFVELGLGLVRAQQFYDAEKRGSAALAVAAKHWNYSPKSSGLLQTVGALKSYGLMEDEGRGLDRRVKLSDLALRIMLDSRPGAREAALIEAALSPSVAQRIKDKFPNDLPSVANLDHFLIFELKFSEDAAEDAAEIYIKNSELASIYGESNISASTELKDEPMEHPNPPLPSLAQATGKMENIIGPDGTITIRFADEPTWESYDFLESYIKLRKTVLKAGTLGAKKDAAETVEADPKKKKWV